MKKNLTHLNIEIISKEYLGGLSMLELSNKYNISISYLFKQFKKLGIRKTTKRFLDENSFSVYTPENCYWAGFIGADGNIFIGKGGHRVSIQLAQKDKNHLEKFNNFLRGNYTIEERTSEKGNTLSNLVAIQVYSKKLAMDLFNNFNIIPNKSFTLQPPNLPPELVKHYIRGYFDGDGHIEKRSNISLGFTITSGSKAILKWMMGALRENGFSVSDKYIYSAGEQHNYFRILIGHKIVAGIYKWLYEDSKEETRLGRKYETFCRLTKEIEDFKDAKQTKQNKIMAELEVLQNKGLTAQEIMENLKASQGKIQYYLNKSTDIYTNKKHILERDLNILKCKKNKEKVDFIVKKFNISKSSYFIIIKRVETYLQELK